MRLFSYEVGLQQLQLCCAEALSVGKGSCDNSQGIQLAPHGNNPNNSTGRLYTICFREAVRYINLIKTSPPGIR